MAVVVGDGHKGVAWVGTPRLVLYSRMCSRKTNSPISPKGTPLKITNSSHFRPFVIDFTKRYS